MTLERHSQAPVVRAAFWLYLLEGINGVGVVVVALITQFPGIGPHVDLRPLAAGMILTTLLGAAELRTAFLLRDGARAGAWMALGLAAILLVVPAMMLVQSGPLSLLQLGVLWRVTIAMVSVGAWYELVRRQTG